MKPRALVAEFIGTFALLFTIFCVVTNFTGNPIQLFAIALGVGLTIMIMGTAFGAISGGHFNPCVTFGMMVAKKMDAVSGVAYIATQLVGATASVFAASFLYGPNGDAARKAVTVSRGAGIELAASIAAEAIAAFFFVTAIFMTAVDKRAPKNGALYLGLTLTIGILAIGPISGGAINPAVGFAASIGSGNWDNAASWSVGPLLGAAVAALCYVGLWQDGEGA